MRVFSLTVLCGHLQLDVFDAEGGFFLLFVFFCLFFFGSFFVFFFGVLFVFFWRFVCFFCLYVCFFCMFVLFVYFVCVFVCIFECLYVFLPVFLSVFVCESLGAYRLMYFFDS